MTDIERELRELGERTEVRTGTLTSAPEQIVRRVKRRRIAAVLGSAALAATIAVGSVAAFRTFGTGVETVGNNVLLAAAEATESQRTAKMTMNAVMGFEGGVFDNEIEMKGVGETDFVKDRSSMLMSTELPMVGKQQFETIQVGTTVYTKGQPGFDPDTWVRSEMNGGALSGLSGTGGTQQSPEDYLGYLKSVSGDIQVIGTDEIDGITVTHYRAEISRDVVEESLAQMPDEMQSRIDGYDFELDPVEVWIDRNDLVRRLDFGMMIEMSIDGSEFGMDMTMTTRFYDFGTPVDIQIPAEGDVVDQPNPFEAEGEGRLEIPEVEANEGPSDMQVTILSTQDRVYGPTVSFGYSESKGFLRGCIFEVPRWVVRAELVEDHTGRVLMAVEGFTGETHRIGCASENLSEVIEDVTESPTDYSIRFAAVGRTETIPIVEVVGPPE